MKEYLHAHIKYLMDIDFLAEKTQAFLMSQFLSVYVTLLNQTAY